MILRGRKRRGQSVIEFAALLMFILAVFLVFQKYIVRGFSGRWKGVGDALGEGRIYDPKKTIECAYSKFFAEKDGRWYDRACFERECEDACLKSRERPGAAEACDTCLADCGSEYCDDS